MINNYLKLFFTAVFINPERCRWVSDPPILSLETEEILKRPTDLPLTNIESDRYLFEAAQTTEEKIIVTTDVKLMKHFEGNGLFQLWSADDFFLHFDI